jgi:hypothetical protein
VHSLILHGGPTPTTAGLCHFLSSGAAFAAPRIVLYMKYLFGVATFLFLTTYDSLESLAVHREECYLSIY